MQTGNAFTTPFGRRSLSLGMLATQVQAREVDPEAAVDKWKLFRSLCEARALIGISDRALVVLNALLTFYPQSELTEANGLVVFPSNVQLSLRSHGMAPATLRRHLSALVETGLIFRKDSPNGKRYARKARTGAAGATGAGEGGEAFGFSLAPLVVRASEFEAMAEEVRSARLQLKLMKERVTLLRRDIIKLIELGFEEMPHIDWNSHHTAFRGVIDALPRQATADDLEPVIDGLECIQLEISKLLQDKLNLQQTSAKESHFERHKQNSNTKSTSDLEPGFRKDQGRNTEPTSQPDALGQTSDSKGITGQPESTPGHDVQHTADKLDRNAAGAGQGGLTGGRAMAGGLNAPSDPSGLNGDDDISDLRTDLSGRSINLAALGASVSAFDAKPVPLGLVRQACPDIAAYAKNGLSSWSELMGAAIVVRSMLGVSPSAYEEACTILGQENAAIAIACILQRAGHINSAGGYLRSLTDKAAKGEFSVWPMLLAQLRANGTHVRVVGK
ncbi:replication initiation protein RepC (plasmid) [Phyllobacterium sp. 628]|uniref:plasmid replication protein RepC n=1 Tax=Phyllobacterium sp. 628 TaxID=2718938 RepID=UPI0016625F46|nr:plasmid replication protein RepC [Phyllobacterium sp. 628]QND50515.1 replication initiation protein RepC [Phyllobacterium sp. 628]